MGLTTWRAWAQVAIVSGLVSGESKGFDSPGWTNSDCSDGSELKLSAGCSIHSAKLFTIAMNAQADA